VARKIPDALTVPASALVNTPDGTSAVMVVGSDDRAHQQKVEVGVHQGDQVQIVSGLQSGQRVITSGAYGLRDNTRVREEGAPAKESAGG
jgi:multidrug efflux pump subunit AcrA (membrane-fusion protein)